MPSDGTVISNIVLELKNTILHGRIDKIHQPEKDEIVLTVRNNSNSYKLMLSSNASYPRLNLTDAQKQNPQHAPMFCMLLRKYILNGKIIEILQPDFERIVEIHIQSTNELGDKSTKKLIIEIMGKHSNIILVDENNKVLDSIKHVTNEISSVREVYPGTNYFVPPSDKFNPLTISKQEFLNIFENININTNISKILLKHFNGFGKIISDEIEHRYNIANQSDNFNLDLLYDEFLLFAHKVDSSKYVPTLYFDDDKTNPIDFSSVNLLQYINNTSKTYESISEVIEKFYSENDLKNRIMQKTDSLRKNINVLLDRSKSKLANLEQKKIECKDKDKYKIWGELILANIHNISKGNNSLIATDYYSQEQETIAITLDQQLSPSENAQRYFKKYNKLKRTQDNVNSLIIETINDLNYFESILLNLENCISEDDINDIKLELISEGYLKKSKISKKDSQSKSKPLKFISTDGFTILVGKNNTQNDYLTFKISNKSDIWFHTKTIHGSHVIVRTDNKEVPDKTLEEAAILASYYSKGRLSSNIEIDYTTIKNVKKPSGAKPGMVNYFNYSTIVVNPDKNLVEKLKAIK